MRNDCKFFERSWLLIFSTVIVLLTGCERYALDRKMEELCKKDGGVRVYKTVSLPPAEYEILFNYARKRKSQEDYYGPEYLYVSEDKHLVGKDDDAVKGRVELIRHYSAIYKRQDGHMLGEAAWYTRVGGDLLFAFGFQSSSNSCPRPRSDLARSVFLKGE